MPINYFTLFCYSFKRITQSKVTTTIINPGRIYWDDFNTATRCYEMCITTRIILCKNQILLTDSFIAVSQTLTFAQWIPVCFRGAIRKDLEKFQL